MKFARVPKPGDGLLPLWWHLWCVGWIFVGLWAQVRFWPL